MEDIHSRDILSSFSRISKQWGLGKPVGKVWGFLLSNPKEINQEQIESGTGYSRGLVSKSLNKLKELNMLNVRRKGKIYLYSANTSLIKGFNRIIKNFLKEEIEPTIETLSVKMDKIKEKSLKEEAEKMAEEYKKLKTGIKLFSKTIEDLGLEKIENLKKITKNYEKQ